MDLDKTVLRVAQKMMDGKLDIYYDDPVKTWVRGLAQDAVDEGLVRVWRHDFYEDEWIMIEYTKHGCCDPDYRLHILVFNIREEIDRLTETAVHDTEKVDDHTGMVQNPMTGEWSWF